MPRLTSPAVVTALAATLLLPSTALVSSVPLAQHSADDPVPIDRVIDIDRLVQLRRVDALAAEAAALAAAAQGGVATVQPASWSVGGVSGIPATVLAAYRTAEANLAASNPSCRLPWWVLAGIGRIESGHASGGRVDANGTTRGRILGPRLDGSVAGTAVVGDSDGGALDGDPGFDRAVGPMQFLPATWRAFARDGNGDKVADPNNVFDAAAGAGVYLCRSGGDLSVPANLVRAVLAYNPSDSYVSSVLSWGAAYRDGVSPVADAAGTVPQGVQRQPATPAPRRPAATTLASAPLVPSGRPAASSLPPNPAPVPTPAPAPPAPPTPPVPPAPPTPPVPPAPPSPPVPPAPPIPPPPASTDEPGGSVVAAGSQPDPVTHGSGSPDTSTGSPSATTGDSGAAVAPSTPSASPSPTGSVDSSAQAEQVAVPGVLGQTEERARALLTKAGLVADMQPAADPARPEGTVTAQDSPSGTLLDRGSTVHVTVSSGPKEAAVPTVVGQPKDAAKTALAAAGFANVTVVLVDDPSQSKGKVVGTEPEGKPSEVLPVNTNITVRVASGNVKVPELVGLDTATAALRLSALGLAYDDTQQVQSATVPDGQVVSQEQAPGTVVGTGTTVTVTVAAGPPAGERKRTSTTAAPAPPSPSPSADKKRGASAHR